MKKYKKFNLNNSQTTFNNNLNNNIMKSNMNQTLANKNQTSSRGKLMNYIRKGKNEDIFKETFSNNNNLQLKRVNKEIKGNRQQLENYNQGGISKSIEYNNNKNLIKDIKNSNKFSKNEITFSAENFFKINKQNEVSLNNSDLMHNRIDESINYSYNIFKLFIKIYRK